MKQGFSATTALVIMFWQMALPPAVQADLSGVSLTGTTPIRLTPATFDLIFEVTAVGGDFEFIDALTVDLPPSWTVNLIRPTAKASGCGGGTTVEQTGNQVRWLSDLPLPTGCGPWVTFAGSTVKHLFAVNVTIPDCNGEPWTIPWTLQGDGRGAAPHIVIGSLGLGSCYLPTSSPATSYRFTTIDHPDGTETRVRGINDHGVLVGDYLDGGGTQKGFRLDGTFTDIGCPGETMATVLGINNSGVLSGYYGTPPASSHGFVYQGDACTTVDFPGADSTWLLHLNNENSAVGLYLAGGRFAAMRRSSDGTLESIPYPTVNLSAAYDINDAGTICGLFAGPTPYKGFRQNSSGYENIGYPGAVESQTHGINDAGAICGYYEDEGGRTRGFIFDGQRGYLRIDYPGAVNTWIDDINNRRQLVGYYEDEAGRLHGFLATPFPWRLYQPAFIGGGRE